MWYRKLEIIGEMDQSGDLVLSCWLGSSSVWDHGCYSGHPVFYVDGFFHSGPGPMLLFTLYCSCFPVHFVKDQVCMNYSDILCVSPTYSSRIISHCHSISAHQFVSNFTSTICEVKLTVCIFVMCYRYWVNPEQCELHQQQCCDHHRYWDW